MIDGDESNVDVVNTLTDAVIGVCCSERKGYLNTFIRHLLYRLPSDVSLMSDVF